ncbi:MAG: ribonucleoside triphosphate reductase, partial [bacterium]
MFQRIRKRDGRIVEFDASKITNAISKAGIATGEFGRDIAERLTLKVLSLAQETIRDEIPGVEEIQDCVEEILLSSPYRKTAKAYILYRDQHAKLREITAKANIDLVDQYLEKLDWQVNENSNMTFSLQGLNNYISSEISKIYWLNKIYPSEVKNAHINGDFHIHDLNSLSVYCVGWDLQDLLIEGFKGVPGKVESKPARHFRSALGQIVNFFYTLQGEAAGAQAFSSFDTLLAPFIRSDKLSYKEVKQALQEFVFNTNVSTRTGFQSPFTNITLDLTIPKFMEDQPVIIGGAPQSATYGEFQEEMDILNKAFLEVMLEGDAKGRVFTFPIPTYSITKNFDWDNPNLDLLWEVTAKYGIPYFSNFINSDMDPEDVRSMCCRLRLNNRELKKRGGGLFGANPLTGSIGVVTINMPRLGYLSKSENEFLERLERLMVLAKQSLEIKRKVLEKFTDRDLYPYSRFYLRSVKSRFGEYWKNHFSTIGLVGMNEALLNLLGVDIGSREGKEFTLKVLNFMREKLLEFQEETGNIYNLEATPAEGTSYRLARIDKEKYPDIICANEEEYREILAEPFYTNSTQLPVNYTDDIFSALDLQDDIQTMYTGGTVLHIFVGERIQDTESTKTLIRKICENYRLPYITIT